MGLRIDRQQLKASLSLVSGDTSCGSKPPIHGLLALASWSCDDCFHTIERIALKSNLNSPSNHPLQESLILGFSLINLLL